MRSLLAIASLFASLGASVAQERQSVPNYWKSRITVGKKTTYFSGPIDKFGYVDYIAALNEKLSKGVSPENNAAVSLARAIGPSAKEPKLRAEYFRLLGMDPLPEKGNYFIDFDSFLDEIREEANHRKHFDDYDHARSALWTKAEYPIVAKWLDRNEPALRHVIDASRREKYFTPAVTEESIARVIGVNLFTAQQSRHISRALNARALLRASEGNIDGAIEDLMASQRLARLIAQGPFFIERLVGIAIQSTASTSAVSIFSTGQPTAQQCNKYLHEFEKLPKWKSLADAVEVGERAILLDALNASAKGGWSGLRLLAEDFSPKGGNQPWELRTAVTKCIESGFDLAIHWGVDWDAASVEMNRRIDRLREAANQANYPAQNRLLEVIAREHDDLNVNWLGRFRKEFEAALPDGNGHEVIGRTFGERHYMILMPALPAIAVASARVQAYDHGSRLAPALAEYKIQKGEYPEKLSELCPKYLANVPIDPFTLKPMFYRRTKDGCKFYSVGVNLRDDDGKYDDPTKADDTGYEMRSNNAKR